MICCSRIVWLLVSCMECHICYNMCLLALFFILLLFSSGIIIFKLKMHLRLYFWLFLLEYLQGITHISLEISRLLKIVPNKYLVYINLMINSKYNRSQGRRCWKNPLEEIYSSGKYVSNMRADKIMPLIMLVSIYEKEIRLGWLGLLGVGNLLFTSFSWDSTNLRVELSWSTIETSKIMIWSTWEDPLEWSLRSLCCSMKAFSGTFGITWKMPEEKISSRPLRRLIINHIKKDTQWEHQVVTLTWGKSFKPNKTLFQRN